MRQVLVVVAVLLLASSVAWAQSGDLEPARPDGYTPEPEWGTQDSSVISLDALGFVPNVSDTEWDIGSNDQKICTAGLCEFSHTLNLPTGARIVNFRVEGCIYNPPPSGLQVRLRSCTVGAACTDLDSVTTSGTGCGPWSKPVSFSVNNYQSYYVVTVATWGPTSFRGAKVHYDLQVSPGPATPTFGDVPTSSGMYKFVEALAASGITGGCGGGNFCPNNPVTRGQMAVFLASALGLHW